MKMTNQLDDIRRQNRTKILSCLRANGSMSRTAIITHTGLSAATVSTITADLLASGIVSNAEEATSSVVGRGRPRVNLSFNSQFACVGVIVLQLNQIYLSLVDYCGCTIYSSEISLPTISISSENLLLALVKAMNDALEEIPDAGQNLKHIGICVQGASDVLETKILWSPVIQPRNVPISEYLGKQFGVSVSVHNDCNIIAKALRHKQPEIFNSDFGAVLISQGIGIGLYQNDKLLKGRNSSGTEFGHMTYMPGGALCRCGRRGCIEAYAGEYGIYRNANNQEHNTTPLNDIRVEEMEAISALALDGDPSAIHSFEEAGAAIGIGLANLFALIDPFPVAIVGVGAHVSGYMKPVIKKSIRGSSMHTDTQDVPMIFYHDQNPFMREGCALTALSAVDINISSAQARVGISRTA